MKKFWRIMSDDVKQHDFTTKEKIVYGVIMVVAFILVMGVAGWLESSCV